MSNQRPRLYQRRALPLSYAPAQLEHFTTAELILPVSGIKKNISAVDKTNPVVYSSGMRRVKLIQQILLSILALLIILPQFSSVFAATTTNTSYNMGVLVIKYFPLTANGQNIDIAVTGDVGEPYSVIKQKTNTITQNLLTLIPKATKYLGYSNPNAPASINLNVVDTKEYTQAVPMVIDGSRKPHYYKIMNDHNICNYVDNQNVREVFLWAYQGPTHPDTRNLPYLNISESKMSGPFGDISNSYREDNMPKCQNTYRVYTFNYGRGTGEALHTWGHQIEAEVEAVNYYWLRTVFQGPNYPQTLNVSGRCGSIHNPPNARFEYDYANPTAQNSDCLNWNPATIGTLSPISCAKWGCNYVADGNDPQTNYIVWNLQNLPGAGNTKKFEALSFRNFWDIHGDFDNVRRSDLTVYMPVTVSLYRMYHQANGFRLWTTQQSEIDFLLARGYINEGLAFKVYQKDQYNPPAGAVPVYRMYLSNQSLRIYTSTDAERNALLAQGWVNEGTVFQAFKTQKPGTKPVYRLTLNSKPNQKFWTESLVEANYLVARGWTNNQVDFYVPIQ